MSFWISLSCGKKKALQIRLVMCLPFSFGSLPSVVSPFAGELPGSWSLFFLLRLHEKPSTCASLLCYPLPVLLLLFLFLFLFLFLLRMLLLFQVDLMWILSNLTFASSRALHSCSLWLTHTTHKMLLLSHNISFLVAAASCC